MRLVLLIPDGIGVRNFILGDFLKKASNKSKISVFYNIPGSLLSRYAPAFKNNVEWHPFIDYKDTPISFTLRNSLGYAHMYWINTPRMRYSLKKPVSGPSKVKVARKTAKIIGRLISFPKGIKLLEGLHCWVVNKFPEIEYYIKLFKEIEPSIIFCSHQRPLIVLPPVLAARSLRIPTATFIYSWDNLTTKSRIAAPFDHYLAWSNHMRKELLRYYPDISGDRVHIVGTPQFDPYADKNLLWSRKEFFAEIGADYSRPLICYSGGDAGNCPEDPEHAKILMELIRSKKIKKNPQVILRPAPVDDGKRYAELRKKYPELIYAKPDWIHTEPNNWAKVFPLSEDVKFLTNLIHHSDLNINRASTMTLDFSIHGKPVVNVAFDVAHHPLRGVPTWEYCYNKATHYKPVVELGAARFARSKEELAEHVNAYLENPALDREGRQKIVELEVGKPIGQANECIINTLERIAKK